MPSLSPSPTPIQVFTDTGSPIIFTIVAALFGIVIMFIITFVFGRRTPPGS